MWGREPVGGPFALIDHTGKPRTEQDFKGKLLLVYFGFTYCPDICPTDLQDVGLAIDQLGEAGDEIQPLFITVDPERDTPQILGDYVSFVSDRIVGLTGSQAEIDKVVRDWGAVAERVPQDDGSYLMNHTASVFLVNAKGEFAGTIAYGEDTKTALEKIKRLVANS